MPSPLIPLKRIISPPPTSLQAHPFAIPISRKKLRANQIISHGPSPSQQKSDSSQKKSRNQHISERTDPTPNHRISQDGQKRSDCQRDRTQLRSRCAGAPAAGRQTYKVDREFRTSRRALNVLSVRARTVRAGDLICLPPGGGGSSPVSPASSSASSAVPGSVHHGGQARCRRWGSPA